MKAKVNLKLLSTKTFDSGALGMMATVVHQFPRPGHYRAVIKKQGDAETEMDFLVGENSTVMQLDIDLSIAIRKAKARPGDDCCKDINETPRIVSPKGYTLFFASSGSGYSVTVINSDDKIEFDSTKLSAGDLFAISLLEPGTYSMVNKLEPGEGEIVVNLTPKMAKKIRNLETAYINVSQKGFDPKSMELTSSQGLVFRINDSARVLIEKKEKTKREYRKPMSHWQKPQMAKKKR